MSPSPHPRSIPAFLATARRALTAPKSQRQLPLHLVVGNESADLDSFCSAFLYAYLRSHTAPAYTLHIPLANIPHDDIRLRRDVESVFATAGVPRDQLLSLSDLPAEQDLAPADTRWVLVDHNELTGLLAERGFASSVVGCIDHHVDEGTVPIETGDEPRVIRPCGSSVSLILQFCRDTWDRVAADSRESGPEDAAPSVPARLARLAMGPILADTYCLKSKSKTTQLDLDMAEVLEARIRSEGLDYDREAYFKELGRLKEDMSGFSYRDVLRKDYKEWFVGEGRNRQSIGISAIPRDFDHLLKHIGPKEKLFDAMSEWAADRGLDVVSIMTTTFRGDDMSRELLIWGINERGTATARQFVDLFAEKLQLQRWGSGELDDFDDNPARTRWRRCWHQLNIDESRKQVAPMLREAAKSVVQRAAAI